MTADDLRARVLLLRPAGDGSACLRARTSYAPSTGASSTRSTAPCLAGSCCSRPGTSRRSPSSRRPRPTSWAGWYAASALALESVTGCVKTYLMQFSEAEGFSHLHLHLVPRSPDHPADARGPRVFAYLTEDEAQWLPAAERDRIALSAPGRPRLT